MLLGALIVFSLLISCSTEEDARTAESASPTRRAPTEEGVTLVDMAQFGVTPLSVVHFRGDEVGILGGGEGDGRIARGEAGIEAFILDAVSGRVRKLPTIPVAGWVVNGAVMPAGNDLVVAFTAVCSSEPVETDSGPVCSLDPAGEPVYSFLVLRGDTWVSIEEESGVSARSFGIDSSGGVVAVSESAMVAVTQEETTAVPVSAGKEFEELDECSLLKHDGARVIDDVVSFVDSTGARTEAALSSVWLALSDGKQTEAASLVEQVSCLGLRSDGPFVTAPVLFGEEVIERTIDLRAPSIPIQTPFPGERRHVEVGGGLNYLSFGIPGESLVVIPGTDYTNGTNLVFEYPSGTVLTAEHAIVRYDLSGDSPYIERIVPLLDLSAPSSKPSR